MYLKNYFGVIVRNFQETVLFNSTSTSSMIVYNKNGEQIAVSEDKTSSATKGKKKIVFVDFVSC